MFEMRNIGVFALVLLAACSPTSTAVSPSTNSPIEPIPTTQVVIPTALILPTVAGGMETSGLWLQVLSPLDEAVVDAPQVDVTGSAPAGTVISVNDEILIVDVEAQFKTTVSLEEGPNLIEIIASDENGNELSLMLTITYEP